MILIKVWYRFTGLMLKWLYRIVFHGDFVYGKRFHMRRAFQLTIENGGRVVLGDDVFFNDFCALHARKSITIGDGTIFGENVRIYDHNHRLPIRRRRSKTKDTARLRSLSGNIAGLAPV